VLQRAIADYRKDKPQPAVIVQPNVERIAAVPKLDSSPHITSSGGDSGSNVSSRATTGSKRKYRRHPKVYFQLHIRAEFNLLTVVQPDENAPDRPPSAYVLFSNRTQLHISYVLDVADKFRRSKRASQRKGFKLHRDCQDGRRAMAGTRSRRQGNVREQKPGNERSLLCPAGRVQEDARLCALSKLPRRLQGQARTKQ
jgi:hypothetical protein